MITLGTEQSKSTCPIFSNVYLVLKFKYISSHEYDDKSNVLSGKMGYENVLIGRAFFNIFNNASLITFEL